MKIKIVSNHADKYLVDSEYNIYYKTNVDKAINKGSAKLIGRRGAKYTLEVDPKLVRVEANGIRMIRHRFGNFK